MGSRNRVLDSRAHWRQLTNTVEQFRATALLASVLRFNGDDGRTVGEHDNVEAAHSSCIKAAHLRQVDGWISPVTKLFHLIEQRRIIGRR